MDPPQSSQDKPAVSSLVTYLLSKLEPASPFHSQLTELLQAPSDGSSPAAPKHVGLVLSERMVNMPTQIVPPMYRMLQEELQWATEEVRLWLPLRCLWTERLTFFTRSWPP